MQKPFGRPTTEFFFGFSSLLSAALYGFRLLLSLRADTMLVGGAPYPTEHFVHLFATTCVLGSLPFLVIGTIGVLTLNEGRRRYIASLPRWQQWFVWPFHGVTDTKG